MRQVGHVAEGHRIPTLKHARMKTFPVTRKLAALWIEQRPACLIDEWIHLLRICAAVVINDNICDQT